MSKIVRLSRNRGEFFPRFDSRFVATGDKTPQNATILMPDRKAAFYKRVGRYLVEDDNKPTDVFAGFASSVLDAGNLPKSDPNYDDAVINQGLATISTVSDGVYKISANSSQLQTYESTAKGQGSHKWVGVSILTGEASIIGMEWNGVKLTQADVAEASGVGLPAGGIIFWFKFDEVKRTSVLTYNNKSTVITFIAEDTNK